MPLPPLSICTSSQLDGAGNVTFWFKSEDGDTHEITLQIEALKTLAPMMLIVLQTTNTDDKVGQPTLLTSSRAGYLDDGTPVLGLSLSGIELVISLREPGALEKLAGCIAEFQTTDLVSAALH